MVILICLNCEKEFESDTNQMYCNASCEQQYVAQFFEGYRIPEHITRRDRSSRTPKHKLKR